MSHTPVPWDVQNKGNLGCRSARYEIVAGINVNGEKNLPTICKMPDLSERSYANAAFIVRACNAPEHLLRACRELFALAVKSDEFTEPERQQLLDRARAARAKAEDR